MTKTNKIQAILWDMDGTLIDSEALHFESMASVLASLGIDADPALQALLTGTSETEVYRYCCENFALHISQGDWIQQRDRYYLERADRLLPSQQALDSFRQLQARGMAQAVVSNSARCIVDANLRTLDLHEVVPVSVSRDDVDNGKPHPEPYLSAARQLGVASEACLVIEDSLPGARAGEAAGMQVLYWPQHVPAAQLAAHDKLQPIADDQGFEQALADMLDRSFH